MRRGALCFAAECPSLGFEGLEKNTFTNTRKFNFTFCMHYTICALVRCKIGSSRELH